MFGLTGTYLVTTSALGYKVHNMFFLNTGLWISTKPGKLV